MDVKNFLEKFSLTNFPVGLGGCKNTEHSYDCCEYNITIFDGKKQDYTVEEFEKK